LFAISNNSLSRNVNRRGAAKEFLWKALIAKVVPKLNPYGTVFMWFSAREARERSRLVSF